MASRTGTILGLNSDDQERLDAFSERATTIVEWISESVESAKEAPWFKSLGSIGDAAKEWNGTIKFAAKLIESIGREHDPKAIGWLACTVAYKRAAKDAVRAFGGPAVHIPYSGLVFADRIKHLRLEDPSIIEGFSLATSSSHPFVLAGNEALVAALECSGYSGMEVRAILRTLRASFNESLQTLLTGEQAEKFGAFTKWLALDSDNVRIYRLLRAHAETQRLDFEDSPALGIEPFAISDVYIPVECGVMKWSELASDSESPTEKQVDPFSEESAKREDLMKAVQGFLADPAFRDAILIQGVAGAGKSTFTKQLCIQLHRSGLIPIRIPLQYIRADISLLDAIEEILIKFSGPGVTSPKKGFLDNEMFTQSVQLGDARISPFVLIFDGWDEISLSAAEGFQERVARLLDLIQSCLLQQSRNTVRVVLTGRPSEVIAKANFLRPNTPILTIRPLSPDQLDRYLHLVEYAVSHPTFTGPKIDKWPQIKTEEFGPLLKKYRKEFPQSKGLEVLGQPLLAHLAVKVAAMAGGKIDQLITPPTTLYRSLVDLTCKRGGKHPTDEQATGNTARIEGRDLRALLHGVALAITAHGSESIPKEELELRLDSLGVGTDVFPMTHELAGEFPLINLMISFFFKSSHEDGGCEFLHKSFREYLAAEAIVEVLKEFGRTVTHPLPERPDGDYWKDFPEDDPRYWLSRKLGEMLSAQWPSREVRIHTRSLLSG